MYDEIAIAPATRFVVHGQGCPISDPAALFCSYLDDSEKNFN